MIRIGLVLVGIFFVVYGGGALGLSFITDKIDTTIDFYTNSAKCVAGGGLLCVLGIYGNKLIDGFKKIKDFLPKKDKIVIDNSNVNKITTEVKEKTMDETIKIDDSWKSLIEHYDHLSELAATLEKEEDKKLCRDLQHRLLEIHHDKSCAKK